MMIVSVEHRLSRVKRACVRVVLKWRVSADISWW